MAQRMAHGQGLGIDPIKSGAAAWSLPRGGQPSADRSREGRQPCHPLLIRAKTRKSATVVVRHQAVGLLETSYPETSRPERDGQHFGIGKGRLVVWGLPPVRQRRVTKKKVIDKDVEFGQGML
jgi:hypothetical protein